MPDVNGFDALPDDVLETVLLTRMSATELSQISVVCKRFAKMGVADRLWGPLFNERWGQQQPTTLATRAKSIAGSWRALFISKDATEKEAAPWSKPCPEELSASVETLANSCANKERGLGIVFLLDGSGSVHEEDFTKMVEFVTEVTATLQASDPGCKVGVVQFSNDVKVEFTPGEGDDEAFQKALKSMCSHRLPVPASMTASPVASQVRMNGGTNISVAIQKAGQLLKNHVDEDATRHVVLITDGRVDAYQSKEARQMAERLADEQRNVSLFAFGVGRGIDKTELLNIIGTSAGNESGSPTAATERYLDLYVQEGPIW
ncbi:MAG: hypothetical protein WDW38_004313 [Sanguina aurantia]